MRSADVETRLQTDSSGASSTTDGPAPAAAPSEGAAIDPPPPSRWNPQARSNLTTVTAILLVVAAVIFILYAWQLPPFGGRYEQTDNAYVRGQTTIISPQVSGYVSEVPVQDFQQVKAGDVLVRIEDRIYSAKVAQARANVLSQAASLDNSTQAQRSREANELAEDAAIANAQAQLIKAQADMRRIDALVGNGWVTTRDHDQQIAALRAAEAQLRQARAAREIGRQDVRTVIVGRAGLNANVESAKAQVRLAEVDLDHTVIRAPQDGQLSEVGVRRGQYVTSGTQLMFLVPRKLWVTANFKEAQTRNMRVGQPASFTVDALGKTRLKGHVESLAPAAGSEFAVLRPDNATGNFVKVAQRIAVRIRIDPDQPLADRIRPGMSVVARIDTGDR
ncbi:HlyD family secretion protein [Sphingomonas sp. NSE70-1]|uniref:HlyD family secretion protein n=1 Tax=Sphingomonas caseinilyticus TaxID=2908205 RepID=A0ABT0RQL7_9SPHN|nr:HlyD family secretion protein [Sphingomonas caseinilyticus]MCL6697256.1 HlyD family secretion protein [Sphingomonas caseinilyticus]